MIWTLKELLIVLVIQWPIFRLARPVALIFMSGADFDLRRRAWCALTIVLFLSPNYWIFVAFAAPILYFTARRDSNPAAVYLLLMNATPPIGQVIWTSGIELFELNNFMLLALCVMTPAAVGMWRTPNRPRYASLRWIDLLLLGYGALSSFQYIQAEAPDKTLYPITLTDSIRRLASFFFIAFIPYFVTSRSNTERRSITDSIATYCLACGLMSGVAIIESLRGWLLYGEIPSRLSDAAPAEYLIRGEALRGMASSGHPLTLATSLSIALVLWLYLRTRVPSSRARWAVSILLVGGLFLTYSRGPWIAAVVGCVVFIALQPRAFATMLKTGAIVALLGAVVAATPFGGKIINLLPFFGGKVGAETLTYRERLFDRATEIITQHPWFGESTVLLQLEDLRQGEGIIDLVNVYIQVSLNDGLVGLGLLLGFSLLGIAKANAIRRRIKKLDPDKALLGIALIGAITGLFVSMAGGSLGNSERIYYMIGALIAAYVAGSGVRDAVAVSPAASAVQVSR
jgi:O-antigen ligase